MVNKECFFCKKPGKFYAPGRSKKSSFYRIKCNCWKNNETIHEAWTCYDNNEYDSHYIFLKNINSQEPDNNLFGFTFIQKENITLLYLIGCDYFSPLNLAMFNGSIITLDNAHEKLQKYIPFI